MKTWCLLCCCLAFLPPVRAEEAVALVDGEAITAAELATGIPAGLFGPTRQSARESRLAQLVELTALRQRVQALGGGVDPGAVDRAFAERSATPPPMACGCHSYRDYDDYLAQIFMTREEARLGVWLELAIAAQAGRTWEREHPGPDGKAGVLADAGPALRARLRRAWDIAIDGGADEDPFHLARGSASWRRAQAALARLRAGEEADAVAASLGDGRSGVHQDFHGAVTAVAELVRYGVSAALLERDQQGLVDEPVAIASRWEVVRWAPLTDAQVVAELQAAHAERVRRSIIDAAMQARVRYVGEGVALDPRRMEPASVPSAGQASGGE